MKSPTLNELRTRLAYHRELADGADAEADRRWHEKRVRVLYQLLAETEAGVVRVRPLMEYRTGRQR